MLRLLLTLGLLIGLAPFARAQTSTDSILHIARPAATAATYTHADTLRAIQAIYRKHRRSARVMLGLTPVLAAGAVSSASIIISPGWGSKDDTLPIVGIFLGALGTGALTYVALNTYDRNSRSSEQKMVLLYEQKHQLPRRIQRQLPAQLTKLP